jgi:glycosyltransferase involved in cell wall biosynthesis
MKDDLISIVIRTCGRPMILKRALESVRNQSYKRIETIVVEDGENVSQKFIEDNFCDMYIKYYSTDTKCGRCKTGNIGLEHSSGKFINFLDDDDVLLPNHIEALHNSIIQQKVLAVYSIAEEHQIKNSNNKTNTFVVKRKFVRYKQPFNRLLLCYMNYIPIQSILFSRILYECYGGFDEQMNLMEDWDLWVRYSQKSDFYFLPQITSIYYSPFKGRTKNDRMILMKQSEHVVAEKFSQNEITLNIKNINKEIDYIVNVFNKKRLLFYMQKVRNFVLYRDY